MEIIIEHDRLMDGDFPKEHLENMPGVTVAITKTTFTTQSVRVSFDQSGKPIEDKLALAYQMGKLVKTLCMSRNMNNGA